MLFCCKQTHRYKQKGGYQREEGLEANEEDKEGQS